MITRTYIKSRLSEKKPIFYNLFRTSCARVLQIPLFDLVKGRDDLFYTGQKRNAYSENLSIFLKLVNVIQILLGSFCKHFLEVLLIKIRFEKSIST